MDPLDPIGLAEIEAARDRISDLALRIPLVRHEVPGTPAEIYLKLENLQPIGSFKLRGAGNAMRLAGRDALAAGVFTASAGNMAQGVAFVGRRLGVPVTVIVPDHAPETKLRAIARMDARIVKVPFDEWWRVIQTHSFPGLKGEFIHPVCNPAVVAGNGTIGLEILEDLPDVDAVVVPYGGGGLSGGIASAFRALKPKVRVYASEVETGAPFAASLAAGSPQEIDYTPSFVDGIGAKSVLPEMWPLVSEVLTGSLVVSLEETADAIRSLVEHNHTVAEGAGATSVAAARSGIDGGRKVVCVVSGGNIDRAKLTTILKGDLP